MARVIFSICWVRLMVELLITLSHIYVSWSQTLRKTFRRLLNNLGWLGRDAPLLHLLRPNLLRFLKRWFVVGLFLHFRQITHLRCLLPDWVWAQSANRSQLLSLFKLFCVGVRPGSRTALQDPFVFLLVVFWLLLFNFIDRRPLSQNWHFVNRIAAFVARLHLPSFNEGFSLRDRLSPQFFLLHFHYFLSRPFLVF